MQDGDCGMNDPETDVNPPHLTARLCAAEAIHSQRISLSIMRLITSEMTANARGGPQTDLSLSIERWAEELDWLMESCEHTNNEARSALMKAGWLDEGGQPTFNGSVAS
jgi:hypothetical protein